MIDEETLRKIIREEIEAYCEKGLKIGKHSIYLRPTEIDLDGNILKKVSTIQFGSSGTTDVAITRVSSNSINVSHNVGVSENLSVGGNISSSSLQTSSINTNVITSSNYKTGSGSLGTEVTIPINQYGGIGDIFVEDGIVIGYSTIAANQFNYIFPFQLS